MHIQAENLGADLVRMDFCNNRFSFTNSIMKNISRIPGNVVTLTDEQSSFSDKSLAVV